VPLSDEGNDGYFTSNLEWDMTVSSFRFKNEQRERITKLLGIPLKDAIMAVDRMEQHAMRYHQFVAAAGEIPAAIRLSQAHEISESAVSLYNQLSYVQQPVQKAMLEVMRLFKKPMEIRLSSNGPPLWRFASAVEDLAFAADNALRLANEETWKDTQTANRELRLLCNETNAEWQRATRETLPPVTLTFTSENIDDRCTLAFPHVGAAEHPLQIILEAVGVRVHPYVLTQLVEFASTGEVERVSMLIRS
jgi:hypothetical protein